MNLHDMLGLGRFPATAIHGAAGAPGGLRALDGLPTRDLRAALEILAEQMSDAVSRRRMSQPGTEQHRRADERVALVLEFFDELRRGRAIPDDVWRLQLRPPA